MSGIGGKFARRARLRTLGGEIWIHPHCSRTDGWRNIDGGFILDPWRTWRMRNPVGSSCALAASNIFKSRIDRRAGPTRRQVMADLHLTTKRS